MAYKRSGYGCTVADANRGYTKVGTTTTPGSSAADYKQWSTAPKEDAFVESWDFQSKGYTAEGFLTRPRSSTER